MTTSLASLRQTRQELVEAHKQLQELTQPRLVPERFDLDSCQALAQRARELRDTFRAQLEEHFVPLGDGRRIFPHQLEALKEFAENNSLDVDALLPSVIIENGRVIEADFSEMGLVTLLGLSGLESMRRLEILENHHLTSLVGIPVREIESIDASRCGLIGDLSSLTEATRLRSLHVTENKDITSLTGIPTQEIEELWAWGCGLHGDLSAITGCSRLVSLGVGFNRMLTSLAGIPTRELQSVYAMGCGLKGDLSAVSGAAKLRQLHISGNPEITSLAGVPLRELQELCALACGLSGDQTFLSTASKLSFLDLRSNSGISLNKRQFNSGIRIQL